MRNTISACLTVIAAGLALSAPVVASADSPAVTAPAVGSGSAQVRAAATGATETWTFIRRACRTVDAGTACANLEGDGRPSSYRVVYQLQPRPGQWMRPSSTAVWLGADLGTRGVGASAQYRPFCSGTCVKVTTATNYVVATPYYAVYTLVFDTPTSRYEINAGAVAPRTQSHGSCYGGPTVAATIGLSSTSDGAVYFHRSGYADDTGGTDMNAFALYDDNHRFFLTYGPFPVRPSQYGQGNAYQSRTYYVPWKRRTDGSGSWTTQGTIAYVNFRSAAYVQFDSTEPDDCDVH